MFYQCHTTTMQSQDANTGLISNLTILSSIHYPLPSSTYTLAHYHHSQLCSSDLLFLSIKHPFIYFFITPFTHNLYAYICNIYDSNLHAYICSHLSNPVFSVSLPTILPFIYPFIYIYLLQHPSKYIDSYIIISTLSDIHLFTHKATHQKSVHSVSHGSAHPFY